MKYKAFAACLAPVVIAGAAVAVPDPGLCYWENGTSAASATGIASDKDTVDAGIYRRTYDDFVVGECECLKIDQIFAEFLTNSDPLLYPSLTWEATVTIYTTDCWGCPDEAILHGYSTSSVALSAPGEIQGFTKIRYQFDYLSRVNSWTPDGTANCDVNYEEAEDYQWLCEGRYWVSVEHCGDGTWLDNGFWCGTDKNYDATTDSAIQGAEPVHYSNNPNWPAAECTPVSDVNQLFGKRDVVFRICGEASHEYCDNYGYGLEVDTLGFSSPLNIATPNNMTADNFQIPCRDGTYSPTFLEVKVAANFVPCKASAEIWSGNCYPDTLECSLESTLIVGTGELTVDPVLDVYCVQFCDIEGCTLAQGKNYWIVLKGATSGFGKTLFWLYHFDCYENDYCIKISEGQYWDHVRQVWIPLSDSENGAIAEHRDFAFKLCGDYPNVAAEEGPAPDPVDDDCEQLKKILSKLPVFGGSGMR